MAEDFFGNVKPGARVHYLDRHGNTASGTVVINKGTHLVLNTGGRHGTPKVVTPDNYVKHSEGGKVKGALLSNLAKSMKKEETQIDELDTSTLKSYGRKALKDLPKQVKRARTSWDKHVATNMNPDPHKAWDVMIDAEHKQKVRKAGLKRLAAKLVDRGETSVNEEGEQLDAYKSALAYETKKKIKKKKHTKETKKAVKEAYNARETEHSGAKKGKGAYYGRKQDAKRDSDKKRRENDKKACDCNEARGVVSGVGIHDDPKRQARVKDVAKRKIIDKIRKAEKDEKTKHGGWTGVHEERIDEISSKLAKSYLKKTAPGSDDAEKLDAGLLKAISNPKNKGNRDVARKAFNRIQGRENAKGRVGLRGMIRRAAMKEERIDEIGPFNISKHPLGAKALKVVDKVLDKVQDRADARFQAKHPEWKGKAPRKIDYSTKFPGEKGKKEYERIGEEGGSNFGQRLNEISKDKLAAYIRRASRSAAASSEEGGVAWARTALNTKDLDKAEKAERKHIDKARKRIKGIERATGKLHGGDLYTNVPATNEGRESEYRANMQLAGTARRKPGHYLVRSGSTLSGPHEPHDALRKYKDMNEDGVITKDEIKKKKKRKKQKN